MLHGKTKILVQFNDDKLPYNADVASAWYGAKEEEYSVVSLTYDQLEFHDLKGLVPVGSVEFIQKVAELQGVSIPKLPCNSNRPALQTTLGEALELSAPFFIKPSDLKVFTGFVYEGYTYTCIKDLPDSTLVLVYDVFPARIVSEGRGYIYKNELIDYRNYAGNFLVSPPENLFTDIIKTNEPTFPDTYSIDVAFLGNGSWQVVEFNDFWALGNYGMPNWLYVKAIVHRWKQIMRV